MATQNDFLPFATGPGANVVDQATYAALTALTTGFLSGTAQSAQLNKVWRQSSIMAAVIAQFIVAQTGQAVVDDGTTPTLLANFTKAVNAASKQRVILTDTGSVNALAAANPVPLTALPTVSGVVQTIAVKVTNTGASTYSPDGLASRPIFGLGGAALQGGEMVANGIATLVSYVGPLLNGGTLCWVLFECIGGSQQVAQATQPQHAVQLGQASGRLLNIQYFFASGTYTPTAGTTSVVVEVLGGGGAGGGAPATGAGQYSCGGGGGGGSYARKRYTSGFSGGIAVTIGAGGSASNGASGGSGGTTSFGELMSASGGSGGAAGGPSVNFYSQAGSGISTPATGDIVAGGNPGSIGISIGTTSVGGNGGAGPFGGGGFGAGGATGGVSRAVGAGGGGASIGPSSSALAGGGGTGGICIVYEYGTAATVA